MDGTIDKQREVFKMLWPDKCWPNWDDDCNLPDGPCIGGVCKRDVIYHPNGEVMKRDAKCGHLIEVPVYPDLTTWEGFGQMWERAQEMEWWEEFLEYMNAIPYDYRSYWFLDTRRINPQRFKDELYDFGKETGRI